MLGVSFWSSTFDNKILRVWRAKIMDIRWFGVLMDLQGLKMHPMFVGWGNATISCSLGRRECDPSLLLREWHFWGTLHLLLRFNSDENEGILRHNNQPPCTCPMWDSVWVSLGAFYLKNRWRAIAFSILWYLMFEWNFWNAKQWFLRKGSVPEHVQTCSELLRW